MSMSMSRVSNALNKGWFYSENENQIQIFTHSPTSPFATNRSNEPKQKDE